MNHTYASKDIRDYWKNAMNGQPMPEAIKDLIDIPMESDTRKDHFTRDFDIKPNVILYHTHVVPKKEKKAFGFDHKFEPVSKNMRKSQLNKLPEMIDPVRSKN